MIKILITGANSYIGTSFEKWLQQWPGDYSVKTVDMIGDGWREKSFSGYDVVFHVAGIAHSSSDSKLKDLFYRVNCDLAVETAEKSKKEGVKQFIFMSSIIVYGDSSRINQKKVIDKDTFPKPSNSYGDSKLKAEEGIKPLSDDKFKVVILRPPMIYGKGSKGNYPRLTKAALKLPVFPNIQNERSMLHIDNLCEFIRYIIINEEQGLYFPQNSEYVKTSDMMVLIAQVHGRKIRLVKIFNPILKFMSLKIDFINKLFGNQVYQKSMSNYKDNYQINDFAESIIASER